MEEPSNDDDVPVTDPTQPDALRFQVAKRDWSWDAGLQFHYYFSSHSQLRLRLLQDVSGVHQGQSFNLKYSGDYLVGSGWLLKYAAGFDWLSKDLTRYYYGISKRDGVEQSAYYQPKSAWQPFVKIGAVYRINENWNFVSHLYYQKLANTVQESPLVEDNYWLASFVGVNYAF